MKVGVRLFGNLKNKTFMQDTLYFYASTTAGDVIKVLALDKEDIAIVMVEGAPIKEDHQLRDGDVMSIFSFSYGYQ